MAYIFIERDYNSRFLCKFDSLIHQVTGGTINMGVIEVLRRQDREAGKQEVKEEVVLNLLSANRFTVSEIANFAAVEEAFVRKMQAKLTRQKK